MWLSLINGSRWERENWSALNIDICIFLFFNKTMKDISSARKSPLSIYIYVFPGSGIPTKAISSASAMSLSLVVQKKPICWDQVATPERTKRLAWKILGKSQNANIFQFLLCNTKPIHHCPWQPWHFQQHELPRHVVLHGLEGDWSIWRGCRIASSFYCLEHLGPGLLHF